jgi:hypothetical protein
MEIVYMGGKDVQYQPICLRDKATDRPLKHTEKVFMIPRFKAFIIPDAYGEVLLKFSGDIYKRLDKDERKPLDPNAPKGDGITDEVAAHEIPQEEKAKIFKGEDGQTIEDIIREDEKQKDEPQIVLPKAVKRRTRKKKSGKDVTV